MTKINLDFVERGSGYDLGEPTPCQVKKQENFIGLMLKPSLNLYNYSY